MNHIITCTPLGKINSLKNDYKNWTVCHLHEKDAKFYLTKKTRIVYDLYCEDADSSEVLTDWYDEDSGYSDMFEMSYQDVPYLSEVPKCVSELIAEEYTPESLLNDDDDKEQPTIFVAGEPDFSRLMTSALNRQFRGDGLELETINLMAYYQMTEFAKLVEMIRRELNSNFIYADDPVLFAYVVNRMLRGRSAIR